MPPTRESSFGPGDGANFLNEALDRIARGEPVEAAHDITVSPTYVPGLVNASLDLLLDGESGRWHLANQGAVSWAEFARAGATLAGLNPTLVRDCPSEAMP